MQGRVTALSGSTFLETNEIFASVDRRHPDLYGDRPSRSLWRVRQLHPGSQDRGCPPTSDRVLSSSLISAQPKPPWLQTRAPNGCGLGVLPGWASIWHLGGWLPGWCSESGHLPCGSARMAQFAGCEAAKSEGRVTRRSTVTSVSGLLPRRTQEW